MIRPRHWALAALFLASLTLASLALSTARGVAPDGQTEFVNQSLAWAALTLVVPIGLIAHRWSGMTTFLAVTLALLPQIWLAIQFLINVAAADQTGPLDMMIFLYPGADFVVYGMTAALVAVFKDRPLPG